MFMTAWLLPWTHAHRYFYINIYIYIYIKLKKTKNESQHKEFATVTVPDITLLFTNSPYSVLHHADTQSSHSSITLSFNEFILLREVILLLLLFLIEKDLFPWKKHKSFVCSIWASILYFFPLKKSSVAQDRTFGVLHVCQELDL